MANDKERVKKPFYKRWWFWLIVVIVVITLASGGGDETTDQANEADQTEQTADETKNNEDAKEEEAPAEEEQPAEDDARIESGTYKVGTDVPAGEYVVFSSGMAYIENAKDSTGQLESIIFNDNLPSDSHSYVTLNDGEYFKLQGAEMYPVDKAPSVVPENGVYEDGMYKVGKDIPAGEYKVILNSASGMGYLEVSTNSRHQIDGIVTNENVTADMYITVKDGQYLTLRDLKIEK
ncbi:hypothetical protein ACLM5H_07915 [Fredinandcohnia humi]